MKKLKAYSWWEKVPNPETKLPGKSTSGRIQAPKQSGTNDEKKRARNDLEKTKILMMNNNNIRKNWS